MTIGFRVLKKFEKWVGGGATPHASTHEAGGGDVVDADSVDGLHGSDLEKIANKDVAGGYAGLDASTLLLLAQIPALPKTKIAVAGAWALSEIPTIPLSTQVSEHDLTRHPLSIIPTMDDAHIPSLGASKITSGIFDVARIPDLSANKITADVLADARIPSLAISKITNLQAALDAKEASANKGVANGYASLNASTLIPDAQIPALATSKITGLQTALDAKEASANKNVANGYAGLDASVLVPFARLPTGTGASQVAVGNHTHTINRNALRSPSGSGSTTSSSWADLIVDSARSYSGHQEVYWLFRVNNVGESNNCQTRALYGSTQIMDVVSYDYFHNAGANRASLVYVALSGTYTVKVQGLNRDGLTTVYVQDLGVYQYGLG